MATRHKLGDRIVPITKASAILEKELGFNGWSRVSIKAKISESWKFRWEEGIHYLRSSRGISAINVDAIKREIIK